MRIGITGASGFIGSALGALAAARGHEVTAFSRSGKVSAPWVAESRVMGEAMDFSRCDAVVHLAGEAVLGWWTKAKRERIWKSRVDVTKSVVASLKRAAVRPQVLVSASGVGFYGSRGDEVLDESAQKGGGFLSDLCLEWESAAREAEELGVRVVALRTGLVLGREGGAFPMLRKIFSLGLGGRLGGGRQWSPWIHIEDEVSMILWAVENAAVKGALNVASPNPVTNAELTRALARRLRRPALFHAPEFALKWLLGDMASEMFLASQRAVPRVALELGFSFKHETLDAALSDLLK